MFKLMRFCVLAFCGVAGGAAFGITATKEWVQTATNAVLQQANSYADGRFLPLVGGSIGGWLVFEDSYGYSLVGAGEYQAYEFMDGGVEAGVCLYSDQIYYQAAKDGDLSYFFNSSYYYPWAAERYSGHNDGVIVTNATGYISDCFDLEHKANAALAGCMYTLSAASTYAAATNSVRHVTPDAIAPIVVSPPAAVPGRARDWVVYVTPPGSTSITLSADAHWYAAEGIDATTARGGKITMFAFSEIGQHADGKPMFAVGRTELAEVGQ